MSALRIVSRGLGGIGRGATHMLTGAGRALRRIPGHISLGLFALVLTLFMMVNASSVFGPAAPRFQAALNVYLLMGVSFVAYIGRGHPLMKESLAQSLPVLAVAYVATALILLGIASATGFRPPNIATGTASLTLVLVTVVVIAYNEEVIFRELLPALLEKAVGGRYAAQFVSAAVFAVFHWSVYGGQTQPLLTAFVAGIVFGLARESVPRGLTVVIAAHAAYNSFALGIL